MPHVGRHGHISVNLGCEAFTGDQPQFALDKVDKLKECIRSLHVRIIRQELRDIQRLREKMGDDGVGGLCANQLPSRFLR